MHSRAWYRTRKASATFATERRTLFGDYTLAIAIIVVAGVSFMLWAVLKAAHDDDERSGMHDD